MTKLSSTSSGLAVLRIKIYPSSRLFFMITFFFSKTFVGHFPPGNESKWNVFALTHERHRFVYIYLFTRTPSTSDSSFRILFLSGLSFELINPFLFLLILISHLARKLDFSSCMVILICVLTYILLTDIDTNPPHTVLSFTIFVTNLAINTSLSCITSYKTIIYSKCYVVFSFYKGIFGKLLQDFEDFLFVRG